MLNINDLEKLRDAFGASNDLAPIADVGQIGDPAIEAIVVFAVEQMSCSDRNKRVLALRVLQHFRGDRALQGLLAGLRDEKRRVCAAAIQACPNYLDVWSWIIMVLVPISKRTNCGTDTSPSRHNDGGNPPSYTE